MPVWRIVSVLNCFEHSHCLSFAVRSACFAGAPEELAIVKAGRQHDRAKDWTEEL